MEQLLMDIKSHNLCKLVEIYYDAENKPAERLYTGFGFKVSGAREDGDVIADRPI